MEKKKRTKVPIGEGGKPSQEFKEWMAGEIDGKGQISMSKEGCVSLEITNDAENERCLQEIKQYYGGAVKARTGSKSVRYRLHDEAQLRRVVGDINGEIRHPGRKEQLKRVCSRYNIDYKEAKALTGKSGWIMGMFDSEGAITGVTKAEPEITIKIRSRYKEVTESITGAIGGETKAEKSGQNWWYISSQSDIEKFVLYGKEYPSRSPKKNRLLLIEKFYELKGKGAYKAEEGTVQRKAWEEFLDRWGRTNTRKAKAAEEQEERRKRKEDSRSSKQRPKKGKGEEGKDQEIVQASQKRRSIQRCIY